MRRKEGIVEPAPFPDVLLVEGFVENPDALFRQLAEETGQPLWGAISVALAK